MDLDFNGFYKGRSEQRYRSKPVAKRKKKKVKKKKKKPVPKGEWDNSLTNRDQHKLSQDQRLERKLNAVSKHRHYAKDLVQEQKRRNLEKRRLELEEKEIEREEKQLIRRKQLLLRKNTEPHFKRRFPAFTAGRSDSEEEEEETASGEEYESVGSDGDDIEHRAHAPSADDAQMTLRALTQKLSSLENELETIKTNKSPNSLGVKSREESARRRAGLDDDVEIIESADNDNGAEITLNLESIEKTLNAAKEKRGGKTVHLTMPSMPSMPSVPSSLSNVSQPPQMAPQRISTEVDSKEDVATNKALGSLDVSSLMMLLEKMKIYFKEIQIEKTENEEFRSSILTSVNAQNTQILHLLSQLAAQQKEMDQLRDTVATLTDKLTAFERTGPVHSAPKWTKSAPNAVNAMAVDGDQEVVLNDIKNAIADSRPNALRTQTVLQDTDWKSISNVLAPKYDTFPSDTMPQRPYTVQRHHTVQKRSFLPSAPPQEPPKRKMILPSKQSEQGTLHRVAPPPQPVPKPISKVPVPVGGASRFKKQSQRKFVNIQQAMNETASNRICDNMPKVIVQRLKK